jgi:hypothetical protein
MNLSHLQVYKSSHKKVRIGKDYDGGYIICDIPNIKYDIFISGGIETDISFENNFLEKYPDLDCVAYDGTISELPSGAHSNIEFHKKNLGDTNSDTTSNLQEYFEKYNNIFMKMDIEGGEDALFSSISDDQLLKISQLVIEFHSAYQVTIPSRLAKTHWLVHFHPNNCCGVASNGVPNVYECTYIRKEYDSEVTPNPDPIPNPDIDMPNVQSNPDISIWWPPFILN